METKPLKVSYVCLQCGHKEDIIAKEHSDVALKHVSHGAGCPGLYNPIHIEEVAE